MFVITIDQRDSRHDTDRVETALAALGSSWQRALLLPAERTAGDEFQVLTGEADATVEIILALHREGSWSIGLGIGEVETPLPRSIRAARGAAFFAARRAVEAAKGRPSRFAVDPEADFSESYPSVRDVEALADPLLLLRDQRSAAGWEVVDLVADGVLQSDAAERLAISPQAVSARIRSANGRVDRPAAGALARLLAAADRRSGGTEPERSPE